MTFLTIPEAAEIMRCDHRTIRRAIHNGDLQAARIGKRWLIRPEALQHLFDKRAAAPSLSAAAPRRPPSRPPGGRRTPSRKSESAGSVARLRALK